MKHFVKPPSPGTGRTRPLGLLAALALAIAAFLAIAASPALASPPAFKESITAGTGGPLVEPWGMATDSSGNLYLADPEGDSFHGIVDSFDSSNAPTGIIGESVFEEPFTRGVAMNESTGWLYVADAGPESIIVLKPKGGGEYEEAQRVYVGGFLYVAFDSSSGPNAGDVYVMTESQEVFVYETDGEGKIEEGSKANLEAPPGGFSQFSSFNARGGLTVDSATGRLYIAEPRNEAVSEYKPNGEFEKRLTTPALSEPIGTAIDKHTGQLYVLDYHGKVVDVYSSTGTLEGQLEKNEGEGGGVFHFVEPNGIAVQNAGASKGDVYVSQGGTAHKVAVFQGAAGPAGPELTVTKEGGEGTVVSNPAGIECGGTCSASFTEGAKVTLTASPASGYMFSSWKGCDKGGAIGRQCTVTMSAAKAVVAKFIPSYSVSVTKAGSGLGKVQSSPGGVLCLVNCSSNSAEFKGGASVSLTAAPSKHFHLVKWTGDCSGNGACSFPSIAANHTVGAEFAEDAQFALTVNKQGGGNGTVKADVAGINCGATCTTQAAKYYTGTEVTLTATPGKGSSLKEWTGACTGSGTCKVTMSAAKTVGAKFE